MVYKSKNSPYWQFDFWRGLRRFTGSTKRTDQAEAEAVEQAHIERAEREVEAAIREETSPNLVSILPRHVVREPFGDGWRYYFIVPTKARKAGCPMRNQGLGTSFEAAAERAENVLLPSYDAWCAQHRSRGHTIDKPEHERAMPPSVGVYLLLLKGKVVYVGSSKQLSKRIAAHRSGKRPFDEAFCISTNESDRGRLENILIKAINPTQNSIGKDTPVRVRSLPDSVPERSSPPSLTA